MNTPCPICNDHSPEFEPEPEHETEKMNDSMKQFFALLAKFPQLESLWTPVADMLHAGCHQDCNFCTQVCPTGAIRPLPIEAKRKTPMGLAVLRTETCVAHQGDDFCRLCADECDAAGYHAIEMQKVKLPIGDIPEGLFSDEEIEAMSTIDAPVVVADKCVGCGLCEYRCHSTNVKQRALLTESAIVTLAENVSPQ